MRFKNNTPLQITKNLLRLERGRDELLLANYTDLRPLYIRKGREYINNFLKAASELGTYKKIVDVFPHETNLLNTLMDHEIIIPYEIQTDNKLLENLSVGLDLNNKRSMSLFLLISQSCNMACVYCLNGKVTYKSNNNLIMDKEIAFKSIDRCLKNIMTQGYLKIIFIGGEPLLNWPLAKEILIYCQNSLNKNHIDRQIKYHFTSNLSFLPTDLIEWAKKFNITFLCDIDGPEKIHDKCRPFRDGRPSHKTIVRNIKRLITAGLQVDLRATITALNQDYLLEITEHHKIIGGRSSALIPVNPFNSDEEILKEGLLPSPQKIIRGMAKVYRSKVWNDEKLYPFNRFASRLRSGVRTILGCGATYGNTAIVDINGDVYPCIYLVGIKKFCMGNIMNESYPERILIQWMQDHLHVDRLEDCRSCTWRYICGGSCALGRLLLNKPFERRKIITYCRQIRCEYTQKIMELILWEQSKKAAANCIRNVKMGAKRGIKNTINRSGGIV